MKKKLGALFLTVSSLALSAACASSGPSRPAPTQPDSGENWVQVRPSELPSRPADAAVQTESLAE